MDELEIVKRYLTKDGRIHQYPSKKSLRPYVLHYLLTKFQLEQKYTEKEVNEILKTNIEFNDYELIRRELIVYGFLDRLRDGSQYWRVDKEVVEEK